MTSSLLLAVPVALAGLVLALAPQWGALKSTARVQKSAHFRDGIFYNNVTTHLRTFSPEMLDTTVSFFTGTETREPETPLPTLRVDPDSLGKTENLRVTWLGHSTCVIEIEGRVILTDPMFSERASPFSFLGPRRFPSEMPLHPSDIRHLDAVIISHDHYDHLDYASIKALKGKTDRFIVPLGVGDHLKRWGVPSERITELDWHEETHVNGVRLIATPARHFSGRALRRNRTLWASWVIAGQRERVFFSGDTGYSENFKKIGDAYGPFDITLMESGAYNEAWPEIHMIPEQTVQAHIDLKGRILLPIHWGKFNLSLHPWTEPVERLLAAAARHAVTPALPLQGQPLTLPHLPPFVKWWEKA